MTRIAVAAISARLLAEAAAREGHEVVALDLFGDADTRRACTEWRAIGVPGTFRIDAAMLREAFGDLRRRGSVEVWVPGSGFEGTADLLEEGAALLPLAGTAGADVRRLRDPQVFFDSLAARGIAHPAVRNDAPAPAEGWLLKDSGGCGGWHIRRASLVGARTLPPGSYFQREVDGTPMSLTYLANGREAVVLGFNRLLVRRIGSHPFVFCGVIGPVAVAAAPARELIRGLRELVVAFGLRGLGSLDFMLDGDTATVLEINPRPPASLALYPEVAGGVLSAHLHACQNAELPTAASSPPTPTVRGSEIVFARAAIRLDDAGAAQLAAWPGCHDLPHAGASFAPGDPVCSLETAGSDAAEVQARLARTRDALLDSLETLP